MITIVPKNQNQKTIKLFFNGEEPYGILPKSALPAFLNTENCRLSEKEEAELSNLLQKHAFNYLCHYLQKTDKSYFQCKNYLLQKGFHHSFVTYALEKAVKNNYINDARLAENVCLSFVSRAKSKMEIIRFLRVRRVDQELINAALTAHYIQQDKTALQKLFLKEWHKLNNKQMYAKRTKKDEPKKKIALTYQEKKRRIFNYLRLKGFSLKEIVAVYMLVNKDLN